MAYGRRALAIGATAAGVLLIVLAIGAVVASWPGVADRLSGASTPKDSDKQAAPAKPSIGPAVERETPAERWTPTLLATSVALPLAAAGIALVVAGRRLARADAGAP